MTQSYDPSKQNFELDVSLIHDSIQYMSFDSLYFFRQCNKMIRAMINGLVRSGMLKEIMNRYFEQKIPLFKEVVDLLIKTGSAITGSGILSALMPEIKHNDIDIFIPREHFNLFDTLFKNANCEVGGRPDFSEFYSIATNLRRVVDVMTPDGNKIQIVEVEDVKKAISEFDFDIVRNYYDGEKLRLEFPSAIANKIATFNKDGHLAFQESLTLRCMKYRDKGFTVKTIRKPYFKGWKTSSIPEEYLSPIVREAISEMKTRRKALNDAREIKRSNLLYFEQSLGEILDVFIGSSRAAL